MMKVSASSHFHSACSALLALCIFFLSLGNSDSLFREFLQLAQFELLEFKPAA